MSNPFIMNTTTPTADQIKAAKLEFEQGQLIREGQKLLLLSLSTVKKQWDSVWENESFTPAEKIAAMRTDAVDIFQTSAIFTAAIYSIDPTLLDIKYLSAKFHYTAHEDGSITLN
jgi:hypothetical protein